LLAGENQCAAQPLESTAFRLTPRVAVHTLGSTRPAASNALGRVEEEKEMSFIGRILKYLFWLLVVSCGVTMLRHLVNKMGEGASGQTDPLDMPNSGAKQRLVRDPVCGVHIAEPLALPLRQGGQVLHFCSSACRDKYLSGTQQISASA
jgi:YHS domain-containing protein